MLSKTREETVQATKVPLNQLPSSKARLKLAVKLKIYWRRKKTLQTDLFSFFMETIKQKLGRKANNDIA